MLVGVVLWTLVHTTEALAGDTVPLSASMLPIPESYRPAASMVTNPFSARDFRPRGPSLSNGIPSPVGGDDAHVMNGTPVWQRLADYRSHNQVRLVTLFETGASSLTLQAGRRGDPSLQWTSRLMGRSGAPRGLLDELFSTSVAGAVRRSLALGPRTSTDTLPKTAKPLDGGISGGPASK